MDRRTAARVAVLVVMAVLALEAFTRLKLFYMSKDFRHFLGFAAEAAKLDHGVAFIGNSATRRGVDPEIVGRELSESRAESSPIGAQIFAADASRINTWHFMIESTFWRPRREPRILVLTFYEDDLADGNRLEIGRVAQFFTSVRDWPEVFRVDLPTFSQRAEFVVSSFWATYAARARIRERVLGFLPGYPDYIETQNGVVFTHERKAAARGLTSRTHVALERLLARARAEGSRLCFVAYPTLESAQGKPYELDAVAQSTVEAAGMRFLDLRSVEGLGPELYVDDIHLGEAGRALYSKRLAAALAPLL